MKVRDATEQDLPYIHAFLQAYVGEFWDRPFPQPEFSPDYLATGKVIVAQEGDHAVGMAKGVLDRGVGHISFIYVHPQKRGEGRGKALLRALGEWFAEQQVVNVTLGVDSSNPDGLEFWERLGFHEFHRELVMPLRAFQQQL